MQPGVDPPLIIASLIALGVLSASATLWIRHVQRPKTVINEDAGVPAWSIGWVNFGIFACALVIVAFFVQNLGAYFLIEPLPMGEDEQELTPELAVLLLLLLQLPMLAVFYGARRYYPGHYAGRLNSRNISPLRALREAIPHFVMLLPLVWIVALAWTKFLELLQATGAIGEAEPQELITLFQGGGDPVTISVLVLMAIALAPIVEELIFRGCLYRFLKSQTTILPAQIISGILFSLIHANIFSFLPLVLVGVLLARVYEKTGSILVSIWFHAFFNGYTLLMLFLVNLSDTIPQ
jgi:membrane protease YdiL (CAAX protease family)